MTTSYPQQIAYLRSVGRLQSAAHLRLVASGQKTAEQADFEKACLSDIIAHLEMVAGCEGCADTFPFQSNE